MTSQAELDKAVAQPWAVYETPDAVLADSSLSDAQKRRILESWERDARELAVAEEENMGGGEPNGLDQVLQALGKLPAPEEHQRGPSTKHGAQPTPGTSSTADTAPTAGATQTEAPQLSGEEARQGEVILKTPARKAVFAGAIVASAIIAVVLFYVAVP